MNITPISIEQDYQNETTRVWFNVDGDEYAIADCNGALTLLDCDGANAELYAEGNEIKRMLVPLYKKYAEEYCGEDCLIEA